MAIQIGDDPPPPPTLAEKLAPWLRRGIIGGCLLWFCVSMQNFYVDARSHTIKVVYPLLLSHDRITSLQPGFDPDKAVWKPVSTGFPVADGTVILIKTGDATYAVKLVRQTIKPERAEYEYVKVDSSVPATTGVAETSPGGIDLPGAHIDWTGKRDGAGFLYLGDEFIWSKPPRFSIGVPLQTGDLEQFRSAVPPGVHFESVPWKIAAPGAEEIVPIP
jgi:hypothetical protein